MGVLAVLEDWNCYGRRYSTISLFLGSKLVTPQCFLTLCPDALALSTVLIKQLPSNHEHRAEHTLTSKSTDRTAYPPLLYFPYQPMAKFATRSIMVEKIGSCRNEEA